MRLPRRASLLLALSLLTSAATACAECAWVMWVRASPMDVTGTIVGAWTPWVTFGAGPEREVMTVWSRATTQR